MISLICMCTLGCHGRVVIKVQSVGLNPGRGTCVLDEQDTLLQLLLFTQGYKCVPPRVEVDIVYEKVFGALRLSRELRKIKNECFWPNDQGTIVK